MVKAIEWRDGTVVMLDQSKLPFIVTYIECTDYRTVAEGIRTLKIRGAPAIGIAAAMGIALGAHSISASHYEEFAKAVSRICDVMTSTRPTAVNIRWAADRMRDVLRSNQHKPVHELKGILIAESQKILDEDIAVNRAIGEAGAELIRDGYTILTHCNAGSLATGGFGTATAPFYVAHGRGRKIHVFVDETRPVLQGARLTAWELSEQGIPFTLITDNSAGALMRRGEVSLVIVGTDRVVKNGDVANKIGTYPLAVLAKENGVPFYVAAPLSSIDLSLPTGDDIPIEERSPDEVTHVYGKIVRHECIGERSLPELRAPCGDPSQFSWGAVRIAPENISARNLAFDVTPHRYITGIITERGIMNPDDIKDLIGQG